MKRRGLTEDDLAIWKKVTERTEKLNVQSLFPSRIDVQPPVPRMIQRAKSALEGKSTSATSRLPSQAKPSFAYPLGSVHVQMDKKSFTRLKRGKIKPEATLDLHGMTLDRAQTVLNRFVISAHQNHKRLVLVITGKGRNRDQGGPIPERNGVLRHQVLTWLDMPPLSSVVMQVSQAHGSHGGGGAYYVYLRRQR
ncbi:MAG: Smr/MutS family protein [Pseudomonadota bacterium]